MALDMNKAFFLRKQDRAPRWRVIDAQDQVVGRLATQVADALRGKDKAEYTPHTDCGDYIVVINAEKVKFTGDKLNTKTYEWYTGYINGLKSLTAREMLAKSPERVLELAVKRMLPKTKMGRAVIKKLKIYSGPEHPHKAQITK
jgi:large subunit ribosomal protein L13